MQVGLSNNMLGKNRLQLWVPIERPQLLETIGMVCNQLSMGTGVARNLLDLGHRFRLRRIDTVAELKSAM